jgi:hypothetical protein
MVLRGDSAAVALAESEIRMSNGKKGQLFGLPRDGGAEQAPCGRSRRKALPPLRKASGAAGAAGAAILRRKALP